MAEILLTAAINKSAEIVGNLLVQQGTPLYWLREDIDWLQREMRHIRSYIDNAKDKAIGGDTSVKNLIKDIQELAGDVEDLLDDFLPNIQQSNKFKGAICCLKMASFAETFALEIEKIKKRVADIDRVRTTYNITDTSNNNNDCIPLEQRRLFLHADETEVIGFDDDFNMLQAKLLDHDLPYGVVSIVGMPGLGKTTLAKKLYRHVRDQFECSGLVYVSQQPRAGEILHDIAKQVGLTDNLEGNLRSLLKTKRYVILLDDIWDVEIWDHLKLVVPECDSKIGSRIIITSRNSNVGRYIGEELGGDSSLHVLQPLDSEKSFKLFTKKIFNFDNNNWANAWESKQMRHLLYNGFHQRLSNGCFSKSPKMYSLPPNNLQTLMSMHDKFFESRLLHGLSNLRKLGIEDVSDSTIKILSALSPAPQALEVLRLEFYRNPSEQINLSSYPNIVKLCLHGLLRMPNNFEAFPPNLVKLTLFGFMVDRHILATVKKLPKLRILKMVSCYHNEENMDLSCEANGDSFPQLEVLHIQHPFHLYQVRCRDDDRMPKVKKILLVQLRYPIRLPKRLAKLAIFENLQV